MLESYLRECDRTLGEMCKALVGLFDQRELLETSDELIFWSCLIKKLVDARTDIGFALIYSEHLDLRMSDADFLLLDNESYLQSAG